MSKADYFTRNVWALMHNPKILSRYIRWQFARLAGRSPVLDIKGARIGGFPNFSTYLGASRCPATEAETGFLAPFMPTAKVVLDVGANFGLFTILLARLAPDAQIYAFEPNPSTAAALRENLIHNGIGNAIVVEKAVGAENGTVRFADSSDPATNRILDGDSGGIEVPVCTLEAFCYENGIDRVDFLKIDVEGAELLALEGASGLFARRAISAGMIEICPGNLRTFGRSVADIVSFFAAMGYELSLLGGGPSAPVDDTVTLDNAGFMPAVR